MVRVTVALHCNYIRQTVVTICENFRYHGNSGRSGASLNATIKLADLENVRFGIWDISPIQAELQPILCSNIQLFLTMATEVRRRRVVMTTLNLQTPKPPSV